MVTGIPAALLTVLPDGTTQVADPELAARLSAIAADDALLAKTNGGCHNESDCTDTNNVGCTNSGSC